MTQPTSVSCPNAQLQHLVDYANSHDVGVGRRVREVSPCGRYLTMASLEFRLQDGQSVAEVVLERVPATRSAVRRFLGY